MVVCSGRLTANAMENGDQLRRDRRAFIESVHGFALRRIGDVLRKVGIYRSRSDERDTNVAPSECFFLAHRFGQSPDAELGGRVDSACRYGNVERTEPM